MSNNEKIVNRKDIDQVIKEKKKYLKELEKFGINSDYIRELSDLSLILLEGEYYDEAENNFSLCSDFFIKQNDRLGQATVLGILGTLYFKKGDFQKAIHTYNNAKVIYEEMNQFSDLIICLKGIGNSYINLNQLKKGNEIFLECCSICSDKNDIANFLDCLNNLIFIHESLENWEIVYELYIKSLNAFSSLKDSRGKIVSYFNLGILEKRSKNYEKALNFFKKGTILAIESNYSELKFKGLFYKGECSVFIGKIDEAKEAFLKGLYLGRKLKAKNTNIQIKLLLNSIGLTDLQIEEELDKYEIRKNF